MGEIHLHSSRENCVRRRSLASVAAARAACGGSAAGEEVSAGEAVCDDVLAAWTDEVDDVRERAQLVTDEFWETYSVVHGQVVEATTQLCDRADEAD
jgi:hypothetical protein